MSTASPWDGHGIGSFVSRAVNHKLLAGITIMAATCTGCTSEEPMGPVTSGLPRYALQPAQELHYSGQGSFKYDRGSFDSASDWKIWVTRENDDGSRRLIIRHVTVHNSKDVASDDADVTLAYLDLFPDGRFTENASFGYRFNPHALFARLPADENEARTGWQYVVEESGTSYRHTAKTPDLTPSAVWRLLRVDGGPMNRIYLMTSESEFSFHRGQGLVGRIDAKSKQEWGINGSGTDRIKLNSVGVRDAGWVATLDQDMQRYLEVAEQYEELVDRLELAIDRANERLNQAAILWTELRDAVTSDVVREAIERRIARHESLRSYLLEEAEKKAHVLGEPGADWETTDLDGKTHRLADYAGKIVVLDFWYRGCGWCIRAMPQVNQVADEFDGEPVAVLGMNTDSELEDARFVEHAMDLKYPSLRIDKELPKKYGVSGFPTLVILDQAGIVCDIHVGYSRKLREKVTNTIRRLLEDSASGKQRDQAADYLNGPRGSTIPARDRSVEKTDP